MIVEIVNKIYNAMSVVRENCCWKPNEQCFQRGVVSYVTNDLNDERMRIIMNRHYGT